MSTFFALTLASWALKSLLPPGAWTSMGMVPPFFRNCVNAFARPTEKSLLLSNTMAVVLAFRSREARLAPTTP